MDRRITVSIPDHDAQAEKSGRESLDDFLAEWRAEVGPASKEETAWARRALGERH